MGSPQEGHTRTDLSSGTAAVGDEAYVRLMRTVCEVKF